MCRIYFKFIVSYLILSGVYADLCYRQIDSDIGECIPFRYCAELEEVLRNSTIKNNSFLRDYFCKGSNENSIIVCCSVTKDQFAYVFDEIGNQPQENGFASTSLKNSEDCGIQNKQNSNSTGGPMSLDEFPWLVHILTVNKTDGNNSEYSIACTGTLINSRYVLSSAKCVVKAGGEMAKFLVGIEEPLAKNNTGDEKLESDNNGNHTKFHYYDLDNILIHPSFKELSILHDIALLKLNTSISFTDHIRPVCLPLSESKIAKPKDRLSTAGYATWGSKIKVTSILMSNTGCKVMHYRRNIPKFITKHEMCGIKVESRDCRDESSGNPVLFSDNERWYINGISSWSASCSDRIPKVYTNVSTYLKWIEANTKDAYQGDESSNGAEVDIPVTLQNPKGCGYQLTEKYNSTDGPIAPNEFPWMVYISATERATKEYVISCTGSLITSRYVLCGARCFPHNVDPTVDFVVVVEEYHVQNTTNCSQFKPSYSIGCSTWNYYELNDIVIHPSYNRWTHENNIALLRLNGFVSFTDYIRPICLPLPGFTRAQPGDALQAASYIKWGFKTKGSLKLITDEECRLSFKQMNFIASIQKHEMCALKSKDAVKIICNQYISGPAMYSNNNRWYLEAMQSRGADCSDKVPATYTRVADYLPWIQANIKYDRCTTPNGNMGDCIPLHSCPELLRSFTNPKKEEQTYLLKFICESGRKSDFMVCCPKAKDIVTFYNEKGETKTQESNTTTELKNLKQCGLQRQPKFKLDDGIIPVEEFPWLASVVSHERELRPTTDYYNYKLRCTGAVINDRYVVTTADCIVDDVTPLTFFHVSIAEHSAENCTELSPFYELNCTKLRHFGIDLKIIHPFYNPWTRTNNIALLRLNRLVPFTGYTKPICLRLSDREAVDSREMVYTAGNTKWADKRKSSLELISNSDCTTMFKERNKVSSITEYEMCTIKSKTATNTTCGRFPGGPIMSFSNNRWYLEGIHAKTGSCPNELPAVSTRISNYFQWIKQYIIPETCTTPHGEQGRCQYLRDCPQLHYAFANPVIHDDLQGDLYLHNFQCPRYSYAGKSIGDVILVCCGISPNFTIRPVPDYIELEKKNAIEFNNSKYCGLQHKDDYYSTSDDISIDEYPWSAVIYRRGANYTKEEPRILCTGTLISRRYVLTSASCQRNAFDWDRVRVRLGEYNVKNATDCVEYPEIGAEDCTTVVEYEFDKRTHHKFYDIFSSLNDIALLRLKKQVYFTDYIRPICLPSPNIRYVKPGDTLYTTGWGRNIIPGKQVEDEVERKKKIRTVLTSNEECTKSRQKIYDTTAGASVSQFCTIDFRNATEFLCDKDIGGPLMTRYQAKWYIIGISSRIACKEKVPQIHTNVTTFLGWIHRYIDLDSRE